MNDAPPPVALRHQRVQAHGAALHVAIAGDGPPVILLHGFPENWRSWRHQFPALVDAGFSVWAVDMRGYNESELPAERSAYHLSHLVDDVAVVVHARDVRARTSAVTIGAASSRSRSPASIRPSWTSWSSSTHRM